MGVVLEGLRAEALPLLNALCRLGESKGKEGGEQYRFQGCEYVKHMSRGLSLALAAFNKLSSLLPAGKCAARSHGRIQRRLCQCAAAGAWVLGGTLVHRKAA